jgi:formylglycine-generating enzyme required for sulfatase activity
VVYSLFAKPDWSQSTTKLINYGNYFALITVTIPAKATYRFDVHFATPRSIPCCRPGQAFTLPGSLCRRFCAYSSFSQFFCIIVGQKYTVLHGGCQVKNYPLHCLNPDTIIDTDLATFCNDRIMKKFPLIFLLLFLVACQALTKPLELPSAALGWSYNRQADGMVMVYVPGGTFVMGSANDFPGAAGVETPQHKVTLSDFWIDKTPVTNEQYGLCVADHRCQSPRMTNSWHRENYYGNPAFADYPVIYVNWNDAQAYCTWAGVKLPTEAQWEYAARGLTSYVYPWGNSAPNNTLANWDQPGGDTSSVDSHSDGASWVGALEMAGNVWEWTADWYEEYSEDYAVDPLGPKRGRRKVTKGGSYLNGVESVRSASRNPLFPDYDDNPYIGFRCAADVTK